MYHRVVGRHAGHHGAPTCWVLHGLLGSGRNWAAIADALAARTRCRFVLLDLRCHGHSPAHAGPHTLDACVDDLLRFAQTTGLWPRHLLGHSLGGKVLLQLASRPDDVRRLQQHSGDGGELTLGVLDSTPGPGIAASRAGPTDTDSVTHVLRLVEGVPLPVPSRGTVVELATRAGLPHRVGVWLASNLARQPGSSGGEGYRWLFDPVGASELFASHSATDTWGVLTGGPPPGVALHLVMAERSSRWATPEVRGALQRVQAAASLARQAAAGGGSSARGSVTLHTLANAGHWLHVDNPNGLVDLLAGKVLQEGEAAPAAVPAGLPAGASDVSSR